QDLPFAAKVLLHEVAEECGCGLAPRALCGPEGPSPLLLAATPAQQDRYLRPLVTGRATRCLALTEPGGGSDSFELATTARRWSGGWRIDGHKTFVSNADEADFVLVYAKAAGELRPVPAVFIVDRDRPGLAIGQRYEGMSGEAVFELVLDGVEVDDDALLGGC